MTKRRQSDERAIAYLYRHRFRNLSFCLYCGDTATHRDHVFPVSVAAHIDWKSERTFYEYRRLLITVPSCSECNILAHNDLFGSFAEKRKAIHDRLRRKHKKLLSMPLWSEEELDDLSHSLRASVEGSQEALRKLHRRLSWPRQARARKTR